VVVVRVQQVLLVLLQTVVTVVLEQLTLSQVHQ
jgi:hypothetical protein